MSTDAIIKVPITDKEAEALMWGLAQIGDHTGRRNLEASDPLYILLAAGYSRKTIASTCESMFPLAYTNTLSGTFTELEQMILRLSVENSSWVWHYQRHFPEDEYSAEEARGALRTLAEKLELFGIEVNYLPED